MHPLPQLVLVAGLSSLTAIGSSFLGRLFQRGRRQRELCQQVHEQLIAPPEKLQRIRLEMRQQMEAALQKEFPPPHGRHVLMLPTFVTRMPTGEETGDVYAIDVGGTNFRIMYVHLADAKSSIDRQDIHEIAIPREVYTGTGTQLFDFLAQAISAFLAEHDGCSNTKQGRLPIVGFCWSFPLKQTALSQGILLDWTKGFTCEGVIGNDPVQMLSEALQRAGRPCRLLALINDTVGVLAAHRYLDPDTSIGVIVGTGTNACYVERVGRVAKWSDREHGASPDAETAINIEWGAFDSDALPRCAEDWEVDEATLHKGKYLFEKLLSGMYLGDVARRILLRMARDPQAALFGPPAPGGAPIVPQPLTVKDGFTSADLAAIIGDSSKRGRCAAAVRKALGLRRVPLLARRTVHEVCRIVVLRSAQLVACALHAILEHSGWTQQPRRVVVTFDGGVYKRLPEYRTMLRRAMEDELGKSNAQLVHFALSEDGSCLGAAVLAAAAARDLQAQEQM